MKIKVENYTFDKVNKTVTFTDYATIALNQILIVSNATANVTIYDFDTVGKGGTVAGNVLTLAYDTSAMGNTDKLFIYLDDRNKLATDLSLKVLALESTQNELSNTLLALNETLRLMARQMPKVGKNKSLMVDLAETTAITTQIGIVGLVSGQSIGYLQSFGNAITQQNTRNTDAIPQQLARVSAQYLYDNLKFTN